MSNTKCLGQTYGDRQLEKTSVNADLFAPTNVKSNQNDEDKQENKTPVIISPKEAGRNFMFGNNSKIICDVTQRNSNASKKDCTEPTIMANNSLINTNSTTTLVASKSSINVTKANPSKYQTHQTGANRYTTRTSQDELMGHYDIDSILRDSEKDNQGSSRHSEVSGSRTHFRQSGVLRQKMPHCRSLARCVVFRGVLACCT